jgi:hypothetical protein
MSEISERLSKYTERKVRPAMVHANVLRIGVGGFGMVAGPVVLFFPVALPEWATSHFGILTTLSALALGVYVLLDTGIRRPQYDQYPGSGSQETASIERNWVGAEFDARMAELNDAYDSEIAAALTETLRELTITSLITYQDYSEAAAEAAVDSGAWTDDLYAAATLGGADAPNVSIHLRFRDWVDSRSSIEKRIDRTVSEIEALEP